MSLRVSRTAASKSGRLPIKRRHNDELLLSAPAPLMMRVHPGDIGGFERGEMRSKGFEGMVCSIAGVMAAIGDRWGLVILRDLVCGLSRYEDLRQSSGVTNATLSDRLKHLEASGLVERRRYQVNPERFEYVLTQKGWQIAPLMPVLAQIGDRLGLSGADAPPMTFVNRKTGAEVRWSFIDQESGEQVSPADLQIKEGPGADDLVRWRLTHADRRRGAAHAAAQQ